MSEELFRGIALADEIAPFIIIKNNDATAARSFTLLHELAHIWIGASGVSGPLRGVPANAVERFCNEVAGTFLLPPEATLALRDLPASADTEQVMSVTEDIANAWNISQDVVTYRLLLDGGISEGVATEVFRAFAERWRAEKQRQRDMRKPGGRGSDPTVVRRPRLGAGLLDVVRRSLDAEALTHTKAARILGVQPAAVEPLLRGRQRAA
ncbi:ImmA/IrrE family metallo-endopeptidase [Roseicella aquatilis]|uniref:ImmA/IrrE family metallo-endopeptidase n=1 Tax=Roseicella aquatilis TaxID=2527868 RepID=A0A4R4D3C4_9PROT|nr:ImmA/IrrE family metallo-endopeptidase [Roseicella aquatilis]TCZ51100.1 ImmA/IrrE family metallo-endopeptidase [Roseicella aquatilis]